MTRRPAGLDTARRGLAFVDRPALIVHKIGHVLRRRRATEAYREALATGRLLVEAGPRADRVGFSVVMPVHRVAETHLRAAIASVRAQTHENWELLAVDDGSPDPHVPRVLNEAAGEDARISVMRRSATGGIAVASNEGAAAARHTWLAFLDHDDVLHPRALELAARFLACNEDVAWLFTDEDKLDESGRHVEPVFKPGFSRHLLLAFNLVAHFRVIGRAAFERAGGHRPGFDGAQDWELALRMLAAGCSFAHLPGVLYHWRMTPASMSRFAAAKPVAHRHAARALAEHAAGWPGHGEARVESISAPASLFRVCKAPAGVESVTCLSGGLSQSELVRTAEHVHTEFIAVPPADGFAPADLERLLGVQAVPGTAAAAGRWVRGRRVLASGWALGDAGRVFDPWAGLSVADPGYLNQALLPGRRLILPPWGFVARREALLEAWERGSGIHDAWRLASGWNRLAMEVVAVPTVSFVAPIAPEPPPPPPRDHGFPSRPTRWLEVLGLAEVSHPAAPTASEES